MIIRTLAVTAAAAAALGFAAAPAIAQAPASAQAQAQMQVEPISNDDLTDAQVDSFIDAAMGIQGLIAEYRPQLQAAESEEAMMALQQDAQADIIVVVEDAGLTPDLYQSIGAAAQTDPAVARRLQAEARSRQEPAE
ncbi:MAG: DUF4168 domain-containing protein [Oceanicaulis sp.]